MSDIGERMALVEQAIRDTAKRVEKNRSDVERALARIIALDARWQVIQDRMDSIDDLTRKLDDKIKADDAGQEAIIRTIKHAGAVLAAFFAALMFVIENHEKIVTFFTTTGAQ